MSESYFVVHPAGKPPRRPPLPGAPMTFESRRAAQAEELAQRTAGEEVEVTEVWMLHGYKDAVLARARRRERMLKLLVQVLALAALAQGAWVLFAGVRSYPMAACAAVACFFAARAVDERPR